LINSVNAVAEHGIVKVRVSSSRHNSVRVTVADNGTGISATDLPHIFEAFYTTKESVGSGLGLWVGQQIIEKHGGCIRVHSRRDGIFKGTTFSIVLPASSNDA
jgi:signal transduction histidine kinase